MMRVRLEGLSRRRLRLTLGVFFLALALPTTILVRQTYQQLKWESFHQHRLMAEEFAARVDARLVRLIESEEARSFSDYAFLVVAGDPAANFVQRSPLSEYPPKSAIPGLLGWFQLDVRGMFSTPLLPPTESKPEAYGIAGPEWEQRQELHNRLWEILGRNRLVQERKEDLARAQPSAPAPVMAMDEEEGVVEPAAGGKDMDKLPRGDIKDAAPAPSLAPAQAAFDALSKAGSLEERKQKKEAAPAGGGVQTGRIQAEADQETVEWNQSAQMAKRAMRKERSALPEPLENNVVRQAGIVQTPLKVATFESEIDPFEFARLSSGHCVLFRKVWRDGQRYIQGFLLESGIFLYGLIEAEFRATALSRMSRLVVLHRGETLSVFGGASGRDYYDNAQELRGDPLYRTRLSAPLSEVELVFTVDRLPAGPGGIVLGWLATLLAGVLCGGFLLMYRLALRQLELARQQQDFISAVSHELKTPLTSIRMYGEMLRAGWASEEKKPAYYEFIYSESERLSRLIANILQLSRLTRNGLELDPRPIGGAELLDGVRSKVSTQVAQAGFTLNIFAEPEAEEAMVRVDADAFAQIAINLVDNALKFSAQSPQKLLDIGLSLHERRFLVFAVRDYGPGVPKAEIKKIFRLFYRMGNELTRETVGTGIGLTLVERLTSAMGGRVEVLNRKPGAEFRVYFSCSR